MDLASKLILMGSSGDSLTTSNHYIADISNGSNSVDLYDIISDNAGNLYSVGTLTISNPYQQVGVITKLTASGNIVWSVQVSGDYLNRVAVDSLGNIYAVGYNRLIKYNSSGALQWDRLIGSPGNDFIYTIAIDSSDNIYVGGTVNYSALLIKYNTSGTIQWQRSITWTSINTLGISDISTDSSGNIYSCGYSYDDTNAVLGLILFKYNSAGTLQWQRRISSTSGNVEALGIVSDSSGNVYMSGYVDYQGQGSPDILVLKYNTSGTLDWQKSLGSTDIEQSWSIALAPDGNIFIQGIGGGVYLYLAKYTNTGTLVWQNFIYKATGAFSSNTILADSSNNIYTIGVDYYQTIKTSTIFKLPDDGSKLGFYGDYEYGQGNLVAETRTLSSTTSTFTSATSSISSTTSSPTSTSISLTRSLTSIT